MLQTPVRKFAARTSLAACLLALAACGGGGGHAEGARIYRHAMDQAPNNLDPVQSANIYSSYVISVVYDTLYTYKYLARPYEIKPLLATGMPEVSEDGLRYVIRMRTDAVFMDDEAFPGGNGRPVVAEDFVYSLKRHFDPATRAQGAWLWQGRIAGLNEWKEAGADYDAPVAGLRALDDHTIEILLTQPYPQLVYTLTMSFSSLVPREAVEKYGRELSVHPVGSGPYQVDNFDTTRVVMSANPNYRHAPVDIAYEGYDETLHGFSGVKAIDGRSPPFLDGMEVHFIGENASRWNSFTKGDEVQFTLLPNEQIDNVLASKNPVRLKPEYAAKYFMDTGLEAGFVFNTFNMDIPEFGYNEDPGRNERNHGLRCAMIKAFNWQERNERFYFGLAQVFPGIIPPLVPEYEKGLSHASVTLDIEGGKRLLAEHGWTAENLPELVYGAPSTVIMRQYFEQYRGWMEKIGYPSEKIQLKQFATFGDLNRAWKQSELPLVNKGWSLDFPDAENTLQLFYGPNHSPGSNDANYNNPEYNRLYEKAATMLASPERTAIYQQMNRMLIDDCVAHTGIARTRVKLWHKNVIAFPDREILGGSFLRYVDLAPEPAPVPGG